ncbi:MAG: methyl-accepting chemotaxis protein [Geobacteraceae bacterium]|jgi:methyl-accepting chemotaxis protein
MRIFSIAKKLYCTVGIASFVLVALGVLSFYQVKTLSDKMEKIAREDAHKVTLSLAAEDHLGKAIHAYKDYLLRKDNKYVTEFNENVKEIEGSVKEYLDLSIRDDERGLVKKTSECLDGYKKSIDVMVAARAKSDDIAAVDRAVKGVDRPLGTALEEMEKVATKNYDTARVEVRQATEGKIFVLMVCSILAALLVAAFGVYVARNIATRLGRVTKAMGVVADGDLSTKIRIYGNDEIGDLGKSINRMLDSLNGTVLSIKSTADQVASAAEQLHSTSEQMATGAEEVAAQSEAVATAGEEMAATATDIARNSSHAADGAKQANDLAVTGSAVVQETIQGIQLIAQRVKESASAVENLGERSDQIGEIVGTIEDIADQTNLLALNAAIEAARAGEQGRGFAVVADEVRALAERTTKATKEIGSMIKSIQSETKNAVEAMNQGVSEAERGAAEAVKSDHALAEILRQIGEVSMQVSQIATAAEEQTVTNSEISNNIQQITGVVGETAKGAQETAQAASQLAHLAEALNALVSHFRLAA